MAESEIADSVGVDVGKSFHELNNRNLVFIFKRAAIENLAPFLLSFDKRCTVTFLHFSAIARPGHRVTGLQELLERPIAVLRPLSNPRHAQAAIHVREQNDREGAVAWRLPKADRRVQA